MPHRKNCIYLKKHYPNASGSQHKINQEKICVLENVNPLHSKYGDFTVHEKDNVHE